MTNVVPQEVDYHMPLDIEAIISDEPEKVKGYFQEQNRRLNDVFEKINEAILGQSQFFLPTVSNGTSDVSSYDVRVGMFTLQGHMVFMTMAIKFGSGHGLTGNMQIDDLPFTSHKSDTVTNADKVDWVFNVLNLEAGNTFSGTALLTPESKSLTAIYNDGGTQQTLNTTAYDLNITGFYRIAKD